MGSTDEYGVFVVAVERYIVEHIQRVVNERHIAIAVSYIEVLQLELMMCLVLVRQPYFQPLDSRMRQLLLAVEQTTLDADAMVPRPVKLESVGYIGSMGLHMPGYVMDF